MERIKRVATSGLFRLRRIDHTGRLWRSVGIVTGAVVVAQLLFPYDRAPPFATVDRQPVGIMSRAEIEQLTTQRYKHGAIVTTQPASRATFAEVGLKVEAATTAEQATTYPVWQRLIPLSFVVRMLSGSHASSVSYTRLAVEKWARGIEQACAVAAQDATVGIRDGKLAVTPGVVGARCPQQAVVDSLKSTELAPEMLVATGLQTVAPKLTDAVVASQVKKIEAVIAKGVTVDVAGNKVTAEANEIVQWLTFTDGGGGQFKLDVDTSKLQAFIARVQQPIYAAPGTTAVSMRDGIEIGRTAGANGRGIDAADLVAQLRRELNQSDDISVVAKVTSLAPKLAYSRSYTNSTAGLQALVNDLASDKSNMAIAVTELDGQRRNVSANGDRAYHPASTYKLFVAYGVIKRIEASQWKWADQIIGTTVDECLTRMIVDSDNACAEAFADKIGGWGAVQSDVRATGAAGTNLNLAAPVGTVKDQALFLQKLQNNQLMSSANRDKLLALMKRQHYRAGIPSGAGYEVADKVGFLGANLHDSGLVYTPHGIYALSVYSSGGSWADIADVARRVETLLAS